MRTAIDQNNFVALLSRAIPESNLEKPYLLHFAQKLVESLIQQKACEEMDDPVVKRAYGLYLRANPHNGGIRPSLPELIRWLRSRRGLDYTADLERKLRYIREKLAVFGTINHDDVLEVPAHIITTLRILSMAGSQNVEEDE